MTVKHSLTLGGIALALLLTLFTFMTVKAEINYTIDTQINNYQLFNFFSATTTSATSTTLTGGGGYFNIAGAKAVNFFFGRGTDNVANTGSSRFLVQVSPNGTDWYYWGKWFENASSTSNFVPTTPAGTGFVLTGTSSAVETMNLTNDTFQFARCIAIETTDGAHTCTAAARF